MLVDAILSIRCKVCRNMYDPFHNWLSVWFVNVLLPYGIFMCIDNMYLSFKMWKGNVSTHSQFDCMLVI